MLTLDTLGPSLIATGAEPAACHRRARAAAGLILKRGGCLLVRRDAAWLIVSGWIGGRLHLASYWPSRAQ